MPTLQAYMTIRSGGIGSLRLLTFKYGRAYACVGVMHHLAAHGSTRGRRAFVGAQRDDAYSAAASRASRFHHCHASPSSMRCPSGVRDKTFVYGVCLVQVQCLLASCLLAANLSGRYWGGACSLPLSCTTRRLLIDHVAVQSELDLSCNYFLIGCSIETQNKVLQICEI